MVRFHVSDEDGTLEYGHAHGDIFGRGVHIDVYTKALLKHIAHNFAALLEKQAAAHLASGQYAAVLATIAQTPALLGMQVHAPRSGTYDKGRGVVLHGPEKPLIAVILQEKLGK